MGIDIEIFNLLPLLLPKVIVAGICGIIIGIDRELKQKVAGIRTFILISVGCCLLTAASFLLGEVNQNVDPTRIIGQIITGIGFIGAGVIIKSDDKITGVTTASFIWIISAIGILAGMGMTYTPIILTIGILITSLIFEKVESFIKNKISKKKTNG